MYLFKLNILAIIALACPLAKSHSPQEVMRDTTGVNPGASGQALTTCFEGFCTGTATMSMGDLGDVTLGIAMPPADSGLSELMLNVTVPPSYGSISFTMGNDTDFPLIATFVVFRLVTPQPLNTSELRSQVSMKSKNLVVTNPNLANTTFSEKSALLPDSVQIISRIQSPIFADQALFTSESVTMKVMLSMNDPQYLDSTNETAFLNIEGYEMASVVFDRSAGTFENYTAMAGVLGL